MLGDAVDGAEATDEGGTVDPHNLPVGKKWAQEVESGLIGRGVEDRHEDGRVGDVEVGVAGFLLVFSAVVFFAPEMGGYFLEYNNFIPADPLKTPAHIAPVWYFTPFYSVLRATTEDFLLYWMIPFLLLS